eukprot:12813421-Prorocentrum_lima.AAC.1
MDVQLVKVLGDSLEHDQSSSAQPSNGAHPPDGEHVPMATVLYYAGDEPPIGLLHHHCTNCQALE